MLNNVKEAKDFDAILKTHSSGHVGLHVVTSAHIAANGTRPGSALYMEINVENL